MADRGVPPLLEPVVRRAFLALAALPVVMSCNDATAPRLPAGSVRMQPLAVYDMWWQQTRQCAGRRGSLDAITWYEVPGAESIPTEIGNVQGMWLPGNRIVIAGKSVRHGPLVRHEMLHALLQTTGHPRADFIGRCDGVVVCEWPCRDNDPPPPLDPAAVAIAAEDLEITVFVTPESPGQDVRDGHMQIAVNARNPTDKPVVVQLEPAKDNGVPITWRYSIWRGTAWWNKEERAMSVESTRFKPFESKQMLYDLWIGGTAWQNPLDPGTYDVYGGYNAKRTATPQVVTIRAVCCESAREVR